MGRKKTSKDKNKETANGGTLTNRWTRVKTEDLSSEDVVIGVMGPTGSGKSSFIELASGVDGIAGHGLKSCTDEISVIKFSAPAFLDSEICLVDTPGFDDTNKLDVDVLKMVSAWLNDTYKKNIRLAGLLYFHRITDNRMGGTPLNHLHLFEKLCGNEFSPIVLTTTMWDKVDPKVGKRREQELKDIHWKAMIDRGSTVKRFFYTQKSAFDVLRPMLTLGKERQTLLLQKEMTVLGYKLNETAAGRVLALQLEGLIPKQQELLVAIRNDLTESQLQPGQLERLHQDYQEAAAQLQRVLGVERTKISVRDQFLNFFRIKSWRGLGIWSVFQRKKEKERQRRVTLLQPTSTNQPGTSEEIVAGNQDIVAALLDDALVPVIDPIHDDPGPTTSRFRTA